MLKMKTTNNQGVLENVGMSKIPVYQKKWLVEKKIFKKF